MRVLNTMMAGLIAATLATGYWWMPPINHVIKDMDYKLSGWNAQRQVDDMEMHKSIVMVQGRGGHGTGWFVEQGLIVTNYHVLMDNKRGQQFKGLRQTPLVKESLIIFEDGSTMMAEVIASDPYVDLAMLRLVGDWETLDIKPLKLSEDNAHLGERILVNGNGGYDWRWTTAGVADRPYQFDDTYLWQTTLQRMKMHSMGGFSGSPVISREDGKVVGVLCGGHTNPLIDSALMIPLKTLEKFLQDRPLYQVPIIMDSYYEQQGKGEAGDTKKNAEQGDYTFLMPAMEYEIHELVDEDDIIYAELTMPRDAIPSEKIKDVVAFCFKHNIEIQDHEGRKGWVRFIGRKPYLVKLADFVFRGEPLEPKEEEKK